MSKNTLIEAKNINVIQQGKHILKSVSTTIKKNDFITIIGPNGAGKSTLLKCLMGFSKPNSGDIKRKGGLRIGYVPQYFAYNYIMPITVKRFLCLCKKVSINIDDLAQKTNIIHLLDTQLGALSGGELQRVLLTRSLLDSPELLVLDEPAQSLDISGQLSFYKLLENIYRQQNLAILMVSHDLHLVMASTKQVLCLFHHICCSGAPSAITKDPEFIALFGNDMANMVTIYQHSHNHKHDAD